MKFRVDVKIMDGPWRPRMVGTYVSVREMLNFLAWFRAHSADTDYRATRLRTKAQIKEAKNEIRRWRVSPTKEV